MVSGVCSKRIVPFWLILLEYLPSFQQLFTREKKARPRERAFESKETLPDVNSLNCVI